MLEDEQEVRPLRTLRTVLLGGGPIDPVLRARAADADVRVVATYGSAETAGGCVYDGVALDGVGLATEPDGRLRVSGPTLFEGYDGDPELTARVLVDGWFRTEDAARIDEDGRLQVLGRLDDVVVTGGVNVPAPAVARRLREHPAVREAEVLGVPDEEWGARLVAFVVGELSLADARAWVAERHPRSWAPRQLVAVEALPLLANGKVDRVQLASAAFSR
jgi:O-succinylbenzoic acid--CoA ligase